MRRNQSQPIVASMRARDGIAPAITRATATLQHRLHIENGPPQKAHEIGDKAGAGRESWGDDDPKDSLISGAGGGGGSRDGALQSLVRRNNALILELMKLRDSNEKLRVGLHNSEKLLLTRAQSVALPIIPPVPASVIAASVKVPPSTMSASTQTEPREETPPSNVAKVSVSEQACQTAQSGDRRKSGRKWDLIQPAASGMAESSDSSSQAAAPVARKVKFVNASPQRKSGLLGPVLSEENEVNNEVLTLTIPGRMYLQTSVEHGNHSSPSCSPRSPFSPFFEGLSDCDTDDQDEAGAPSKSGAVDATAVVLSRAPISVSKLSPVSMSPVRASGPTSQPRWSPSKGSGRGRRTHASASASAPASAAASKTHQTSEEPPWSAGPGHFSPVPFSCDWLSPAQDGQFGHTPVKAARKRRSQMVVRQDSLQALGRPPVGGARQGKMREGGGEYDEEDGV